MPFSAVVVGITFLDVAKWAMLAIAVRVGHVGSYKPDLQSLSLRLGAAVTNLDDWRRLWKFDGRIGHRLYKSYWGDRYTEIQDAVKPVITRIDYMKLHFGSMLGPLVSHDSRIRRNQIKARENDTSFWKKMCRGLIYNEILDEHLQKLHQDVLTLLEISKTTVKLHHGDVIDVSDHLQLASFITGHFELEFLTKVVGDSHPFSQALIEEISNNPAYSKAHLAIKELLEIPSGSLNLSNVPVGAHNVVYNVIYHVQNPEHGENHIRKVITSRSGRVTDSPSLPCYSNPRRSGMVMEEARCICESDHQRSYELPHPSGRKEEFALPSLKFLNHANVPHFHDAEAANIPSVSLRSLLQHRRNKFIDSIHGYDATTERIRLAYQLAIFTCVFMDTDWISQLCSCTVTVSSPTDSHYHVTVGRQVHHSHPVTDQNDGDEEPWCQKLGHMPIRRLGFLLAEIGIGAPIYDAFVEEDIVQVSFNDYEDEERSTSYLYLGAIRERIAMDTGSLYSDLVGWCLGPREVRGDDAISQFYHKVLRPLREQHLATFERRGVRERMQSRLDLSHV